MRRKAHDVVVDGTPMVAVPVKDFDVLLAMRRQLGGQSARMHRLKEALIEMTDFLDSLAEELDDTRPPADDEEGPQPRGRRELAADIRERAQRTRAVTGRAPRPGRGPARRSS